MQSNIYEILTMLNWLSKPTVVPFDEGAGIVMALIFNPLPEKKEGLTLRGAYC